MGVKCMLYLQTDNQVLKNYFLYRNFFNETRKKNLTEPLFNLLSGNKLNSVFFFNERVLR